MIRGFYSSASGLRSQQSKMDVIANNISNISTTAFKPQQSKFSTLYLENLNGAGANDSQVSYGTKIEKSGIDFTQGELNKTDMPLDFAISGDGFFSVKGKADGPDTYTRDGSFQVSVEGTTSYLVNGRGDYILDETGNKIEFKAKNTVEKTDENGIKTQVEEGGLDVSKIGVFTFANKFGLDPIGGNQYKETEVSGKAAVLKTANVKTGYLENSAVEISTEMVKMMEASKGFSFNAKLIQTADEMEKTINQLR